MLYIDLINIDENERVDYYLNILIILEKYFFNKIATQVQPIKGNYTDNKNNKVFAPSHLSNCKVQFLGENCTVNIADEANIKNLKIDFYGHGSSVTIGKKCSFSGHMRIGHNSHIIIGEHVTSTSPVFMRCVEGTKIKIGDDCMFATGNQIRTDDAHPIYSVKDGKRLNYSKDITIGNHVWIAYNAVIFGGSNIGDGSIVGFNSLVNKSFPNNCTIAGSPAKIIKRDIFWQRPSTLTFDELKGLEVKNFNDLSYCNDTIE